MTTPAFDELLARLVAADLKFVVVGGLAAGAWGVVRGTEDVDIVPAPDRDNLVRSELGTLDVLQGLPQLPRYADLEADAEEAEVVGVRVLVCSLDRLREMKRLAGRPRDLADLADLDAAHPDESPGD